MTEDEMAGWYHQLNEFQKNIYFCLIDYAKALDISWAARRSNQSILKEINPEYSLERLMLKLKLQYFGHLMQRNDSLEKVYWKRP